MLAMQLTMVVFLQQTCNRRKLEMCLALVTHMQWGEWPSTTLVWLLLQSSSGRSTTPGQWMW